MEQLPTDSVVYFYNLDFDFSQMVKNLVTVFYTATDKISYLKKGEISVIETPTRVYKVRIKTRTGRKVEFIDCYNFCGGVSLNK